METPVSAIAKTADGNLVLGGSYSKIAFIKDSNTRIIGDHLNDIFIAKVKEDGSAIWTKNFGGEGEEYIRSIATDSKGNIFVACVFNKNFTIETWKIEKGTSSLECALLIKLNTNGDVLWVKIISKESWNIPVKLLVDEEDNLYYTGVFKNGVMGINVDGKPIYLNDYPPGNSCLIKWDKNDKLVLGKLFSGFVNTISVSKDNIILAGNVEKKVFYYNDINLHKNEAIEGVFLLKLNNAAEPLWAKFGQSRLPANVDFIHVNKDNSFYLVSTFYDNLQFLGNNIKVFGKPQMNGSVDIAVYKINDSGQPIWYQHYGSDRPDLVQAAAVDSYENLLVSSRFDDTFKLAGVNYVPLRETSMLLAKFASNGNVAKVIKYPDSDSFNKGILSCSGGILTESNGDVFLSGWFNGTLNLANTTLKSTGYLSGFVWKVSNLASGINKEKSNISLTELSVYPNPATGMVYIQTNENLQSQSIFTVKDICGKTVYYQKYTGESRLHSLDLSHLPKGTYIIEQISDKMYATAKLVLQ